MRARFLMFAVLLQLLALPQVKAQVDYPTADSITYRLYQEKNWKELAQWQAVVKKDSLDYYYIHLRLGIALYERGQWVKAKEHFQSALKMNPAGQVAPDYLFRIYTAQGFLSEADSMYRLLDGITAPKMGYSPEKLFSALYLEGGRRPSNAPEIAGPAAYFYFGLHHKLSPGFSLRQSAMFIEQALNWSDYKQFQYMLTPSLYLGKGWEAEMTAGLISFRRDIYSVLHSEQLITHREIQNHGEITVMDSLLIKDTRLNGNTAVYSSLLHLTARKKIHDLSLNLQAALYSENIQPLLDSIHMENRRTVVREPDGLVNIIDRVSNDTIRKDKKFSTGTWQIGGGVKYIFRLPSQWMVSTGLELQYVMNEQVSSLQFLPQVELAKTGSFSVSGYYFSKGFYPVSMNSASQVYNNQDKILSRYSLTLGINCGWNTTLYFTGQQDKITDAFTGSDYKMSSVYIGAYLKL